MTRLRFLWVLARGDLLGFLGLTLALALAVCALSVFGTLGLGMRRAVGELFPDADRTLEVVPPKIALGGLTPKLDEAMVRTFREMPEVATASPRQLLRVGAVSFYHGDFFGHPLDFAVEIAAQGVEPGLVQSELATGSAFAESTGEPLPACISDGLLAIYNGTFAPARGLPQLSPKLLIGFELPVTVGRTYFGGGQGTSETLRVKIVCVSPKALLAGLTLPLDAVRRLNRAHGQDGESYSSITVVARSPASLERLRQRISDLGLGTDEGRALRALGRAAALAAIALVAFGALFLLLAVGSIGQALTLFVRSRSAEIGLLRALGATPGDVAGLVLAQACAIGIAGGALGVAGAVAIQLWLEHLSTELIAGAAPSIAVLFGFDPRVAFAALLAGVLAAICGAYLPARAAARLDPARAMAG
jgi:hypothetical protein